MSLPNRIDVHQHVVRTFFIRHYKDLERGKWVKLSGWADRAKARAFIMQAISRFKLA